MGNMRRGRGQRGSGGCKKALERCAYRPPSLLSLFGVRDDSAHLSWLSLLVGQDIAALPLIVLNEASFKRFCCELLMLIPTAIGISPTVSAKIRDSEHPQSVPLLQLLGPLPRARVYEICEAIWRSRPRTDPINLSTAFAKFIATVKGTVQGCNLRLPTSI